MLKQGLLKTPKYMFIAMVINIAGTQSQLLQLQKQKGDILGTTNGIVVHTSVRDEQRLEICGINILRFPIMYLGVNHTFTTTKIKIETKTKTANRKTKSKIKIAKTKNAPRQDPY